MEKIIIDCYEKGMSIRKISEQSFSLTGRKCSTNYVSNILRSNNIQFRTRSEEVRNSMSQLDINKSFLTEELIEWIDGLMLGDGGINFKENYSGSRIILSSKYEEWVNFGMSFLQPYTPSSAKVTGKIRNKAPNPIWMSRTLWHPDLAIQAKRWYPTSGKKTFVPKDVRITPTSVLLWYLGDGSITTTKKNCTLIRMATCSFVPEDVENILIPKLEEVGIKAHRCTNKNDVVIDSHFLSFFFDFIGKKSPISCYDYKFELPDWRRKIRLRDIFNTKEERWRAMYYIKDKKVFSSRSPGGRLVLLNEEEAKKLKSLVTPEIIHLSEIVKSQEDKWRSRRLIATGVILGKRSKLKIDEAKKLKCILEEKRGSPIISDTDINAEFEKYREKGFPFYNLSDEQIDKFKQELIRFIPEKPYKWHGKNTELASFFFPHIFECRKKGKMSTLEFFYKDNCLRDAIEKVLCLYGTVTDARLRQMCRNHHLSSRINNFPPRVAKTILQELSKGREVKILDPCCGFGGRLLGSMSCSNVIQYVGIDLSRFTYESNLCMLNRLGFTGRAEIFHGDCTKITLGEETFDIVFTSPPFWNTEEYVGCKVERDYERWKQEFLVPLLNTSKRHVKKDGRCVFYLENNMGKKDFVDDFCRTAESIGLKKENPILFLSTHNEYNRAQSTDRRVKVQVFSKSN